MSKLMAIATAITILSGITYHSSAMAVDALRANISGFVTTGSREGDFYSTNYQENLLDGFSIDLNISILPNKIYDPIFENTYDPKSSILIGIVNITLNNGLPISPGRTFADQSRGGFNGEAILGYCCFSNEYSFGQTSLSVIQLNDNEFQYDVSMIANSASRNMGFSFDITLLENRELETLTTSGQFSEGYFYEQQDRTSFDFQSSSGFLTQTVPEPETWFMLIAGFGLAGANMRRRRSVVDKLLPIY